MYPFFGLKPQNPVTAVLSTQDQLATYRRDGIKTYHYVIDGRYHSANDPLIFDHNRSGHKGEPGYLQAMCAALKCVMEHRGIPLTTDFIINLHQLATKDVLFEKVEYSGNGWSLSACVVKHKPALRDPSNIMRGFGFDYDFTTASPEGLEEIKTQYGRFATVCEDMKRIFINDHAGIVQEMNIIIAQYYRSMRTNLDIAIFAHEMNLLHPFTDGNIRLITFLLVNKLLIDEGRAPIMFLNPNIFDAFSREQLGEFINKELQLSGALCQDLNDPFRLGMECEPLGRLST